MDPITIVGGVAGADQIFTRFSSIYKSLKRAYCVLRHAKEEVEDVTDRTRTIVKLWKLLRKTIRRVGTIDEITIDLGGYDELFKNLNKRATDIIHKIVAILDILRPLLTESRVSIIKELHAKLIWFIRSQEDIRLLFADMDLLTGYVRTLAHLVQIQITVQQFHISRSAATKLQVDTMEKMLKRELRQIRQAQNRIPNYSQVPVKRSDKIDMVTEVRKILHHELQSIRNGSTSDSLPPSSPPSASLFSPPTSPPSPVSGSEGASSGNENRKDGVRSPGSSSPSEQEFLPPQPEKSTDTRSLGSGSSTRKSRKHVRKSSAERTSTNTREQDLKPAKDPRLGVLVVPHFILI